MTTRSSSFGERFSEYSNRPRLANRRTGAELSEAERIAVEAGGDFAVCARLQRDGTAEPGRDDRRSGPSPCFLCGSAQAGRPSGVGVDGIELVFLQRLVKPSELDRNVVKPARREAAIEMPQSGN